MRCFLETALKSPPIPYCINAKGLWKNKVGGFEMKVQFKEAPVKIVYIWISREEGQDKALLDSLKPRYAAWRAKGYMPVVMESGEKSLEDSMYLLMKHHYELMAKEQLAAEKSL